MDFYENPNGSHESFRTYIIFPYGNINRKSCGFPHSLKPNRSQRRIAYGMLDMGFYENPYDSHRNPYKFPTRLNILFKLLLLFFVITTSNYENNNS